VSTLPTPQLPQSDLQLEIAHLLLIDIVGYSTLLVNEQIESVQELGRIARSTECFRNAEEKGKLIRVPTGDGMALVFFHSPEEPVRCALEISQKLKGNSTIRLRMGIHSGPVNQVRDVNDTINVAGSGINVAQRVMDCGDAGHILLSKHVADDLSQYRHWQPYLHDLGEYEVKHGLRINIVNLCKDSVGNPNLPEKLKRRKRWKQSADANVRPVIIPGWSKSALTTAFILSAIVVAGTLLIYFNYGRLSRASNAAAILPEKSIAVLPFENRSEEKANAYFADGIQDEILTRLAKISDLKVISRTSTQHYKSAPGNLREIAKQLGVAHIVEGSVQKSGDTVRVNVQLINAANDAHLWADTFDRKLTDIFSVESDIAKTIADQLQAKLTGQESQSIAARPTDNPEAYDAYLQGLTYTLKPLISPGSTLAAEKHLKEAVRLDPKFALGWALLAYVDAVRYLTYNSQPTATAREDIRQSVETALALQPDLGEAFLAKGYYYYACLKDYDEAVRYFEKARQVLPNSSRVAEFLAYVARRQGKWDRSETEFNDAENLDPRNAGLLTQHALLYIGSRRFSDAERKLDQVLEISPDDLDTLALKAAIEQAQGNLDRAATILQPLRPTAEHSTALQIKIYQQILERRSGSTLDYVKEILSKQDSALGYINGQLQFWLGWLEAVSGDGAAAQQSWREARHQLQQYRSEQPGNVSVVCDLALIDANLGETSAALDLLQRSQAAVPVEKDAVDGPVLLDVSARVAALSGQTNEALAILQRLLTNSYVGLPISPLTPSLLRSDPTFDRIRKDARFQDIAARPAVTKETKRR
jgi:TolB-like protein/class 3 adenylate cyclase/Tfp pilus assembly protein PilF